MLNILFFKLKLVMQNYTNSNAYTMYCNRTRAAHVYVNMLTRVCVART